MNPLKKLFNFGGKNQAMLDAKEQLTFQVGARELVNTDTDDEIKRKEDLGVKYLISVDEDADTILAMKCLDFKYTPKVDQYGNVEYARNEKGEVITDATGQPVPQYMQTYTVNETFAALQRMLSPVNRNTFLDPKNKRLIELMFEDVIETAKMAQPEDEFNLSQSSYFASLDASMKMLVNDAVNGNKVKAMLENRKISTLDIMNPKDKQKGLM